MPNADSADRFDIAADGDRHKNEVIFILVPDRWAAQAEDGLKTLERGGLANQ